MIKHLTIKDSSGVPCQVGKGSMVGFVNVTLRNSASRHISKPDWQTRYQIQGLGCWPSVIVQPGASVRALPEE